MTRPSIVRFQKFILHWFRKNRRDTLPWRWNKSRPVEPYRILVSEVMLQQTQVLRVLKKYPEFIRAFPTVDDLAGASLRDVLTVWQGMGYNRRAVYLKRTAEILVARHKGKMPDDPRVLQTLPGIGPYTAGAVACFAYNRPAVFLETNIRKVFIHHFFSRQHGIPHPHLPPSHRRGKEPYRFPPPQTGRGLGWGFPKISDKEILPIAEAALWKNNPRQWHYALMDYGAIELSRESELLARAKSYHKQSRFAGSSRYWRSQIVKYLLKHRNADKHALQRLVPSPVSPFLISLVKDNLITASPDGRYKISG